MRIRISEVWNAKGRSKELTVIDTQEDPKRAVRDWIASNRPDLYIARGLHDHGFHAVQIPEGA